MGIQPALEVQHLHCFVNVARTGRLLSTAKHLYRTVGELKMGLEELEATLGLQLVEFRAGGVLLTPAGRAFLPIAEQALAEIDRILLGLEMKGRNLWTV